MSVVLDGLLNENYEPSEAELVEYGKWLGMNFPEDNPFLWIAREGLKAPLPEGWRACRSEKGDLYYFNFKTGESIWDHPLDEQFKELLQKEKENPSPKSLANGAKRPLSQPDSVEENSIENTKPQKEGRSSSSGKSKLGTLKSLKLKKISTDDSYAELTDRSNLNLDPKERSLEALRLKKVVVPTCSSILKPITGTSSAEKNGDFLISEKNAFEEKLNDELKHFQTERLKEHQTAKEGYELKLKESWNRFQRRQKEEYNKKISDLKDNFEKELLEEKRKLEENYAKDVQKISSEISSGHEAEAGRLRQLLTEKYEKEKLDTERRCQAELEDFRKSKAEELEKMRASERRILEAMRQDTKELDENALTFVETYKKAHDTFAEIIINANQMQLKRSKETLAQLIDHAKETYDSEIDKIKGCFQLEMEQLKRKFATDIMMLQREHMLLMQEKKKCEIEYDLHSKKDCIAGGEKTATHFVTRATQWEGQDHQEADQIQGHMEKSTCFVTENKGQNIQCNDNSARVQSEKEMLESVITFLKETQKKQLEEVKRDLKQRAEEELKVALDEVMRERRRLVIGPLFEEKDETNSVEELGKVSFTPRIEEEKESEREKSANALLDTFQKQDLTTVLTEALRAVFAGSFFISSAPGAPAASFASGSLRATTGKPYSNTEKISTPCTAEVKAMDLEKQIEVFPVSFQEQKLLLAGEHQRIAEGKKFVENQRLSLEERRQQLKVARHQWKQDVMAAKLEGVRAFSKRGRLLNKLRMALETQAKGLEHDEAILRDSEKWLHLKEQNVYQIEQHIRELEEGKGRDISINSVDTVALMKGFFKPTTPASHFDVHNQGIIQAVAHKENLNGVYTKTLSKIARHLEEVTSLMNNQQRRRSSFQSHNNLPRYRSGQRTTRGAEFVLAEN